MASEQKNGQLPSGDHADSHGDEIFELDENDLKEIEQELQNRLPAQAEVPGDERVLIVDGLPVVEDEKKFGKLMKVCAKVFEKSGSLAGTPEEAINMPKDKNGKTMGFAFVEYDTVATAVAALKKLNGYALDKNHRFSVNRFDDLDRLQKVTEVYKPVEEAPPPPRPNLREWLLDPRGVDQYAVRYADKLDVFWNDVRVGQKAELAESRSNWTEGPSPGVWSPQGTYLATFHTQGVCLWGGSEFERVGRFQHRNVKLLAFSPQEHFLVTFSPEAAQKDRPDAPPGSARGIIIWDVRTGQLMRGFQCNLEAMKAPGAWPAFRWSHDDSYFARRGPDRISVYETPSMNLINNRKSLALPGVKDFAWSPKANSLSYFIPEEDNKPARVVVLDVPSLKERAQKTLFQVSDISMYWHPTGEFLAVKAKRHTKTGKTKSTAFELFRMREKNVPVEVLDVDGEVSAFAWEPVGQRFALVSGPGPRFDVHFYRMGRKAVEHLKTLEKKAVNALFWSPRGNYIVLAGMGQLNGQLEFYNAKDHESMGTDEHFMAGTVEWDPTGRFVTTVVSYWRQQLETGFVMFNFMGKRIQTVLKDQFFQLIWRPRPPSLLSRERERYIKAHLSEYMGEIARDDSKMNEQAAEAETRRRAEQKAEFERAVEAARALYDQERSRRVALYGRDPDAPLQADSLVKKTVVVEKVLSETEQLVNN